MNLPEFRPALAKSDVSELLVRRDSAALEDLISWYRPLLKALANRDLDHLLRSKVDASDIVQEACSDVARSFTSIRATNRIQFVAYLAKVLKHKIEDMRRRFMMSQKRSVYREQPLAGCGSIDENILVDGNSQPLDTLLYQEICERLHASLNQLPRELQRVLRWRFRKGMTYKQIGERLDRTEDDARMLVNRCLARVRSEVFPKGLNV